MTLAIFPPIRANRLASVQSGTTTIEYALLAAAIGMATVAIAFAIGDDLASLFQDIETKFCLKLRYHCFIRY